MTTIDERTYTYAVVAAMRPAAAKVLFAMLFCPNLHGVNEIAMWTTLDRGTVSKALVNLEQLGFARRNGRYEAWILTARARQLVLSEGENLPLADDGGAIEVEGAVVAEGGNLTLDAEGQDADADIEGREGENLALASSSSLSSDSDFEHNSPETTTTQNWPGTFETLDEAGLEAVGLLLAEGVPKPLAVQALEKALKGGWDTEQALDCVAGWLDYAATERGEGIKQPGFLALKRLMARQAAPPLTDAERTRQYLSQAWGARR